MHLIHHKASEKGLMLCKFPDRPPTIDIPPKIHSSRCFWCGSTMTVVKSSGLLCFASCDHRVASLFRRPASHSGLPCAQMEPY